MRSAGFIRIPAGDGLIRIARSEHPVCRISMGFSDEVLTYYPGASGEGERVTCVALLPDPNALTKSRTNPTLLPPRRL